MGPKLDNTSWKNYLLERKTTQRHKWKTRCLNQTFFINWNKKKVIFQNQKAKVLYKFFLLHIVFFEKIFCQKKKDIALTNTLGLFFASCFSTITLITLSTFKIIMIIIIIMEWSTSIFFSKLLSHMFYNMLLNLCANIGVF
jgi:hypothetical protein